DADTGERLHVSSEQPAPLLGVAYSPDSRRVITWSGTAGSTLLWEPADLQHPRPILRGLDKPIQQAVFSPDGKTILVAGREVTARLWDVAGDRELIPANRPQHGYPVTAVAFDPSGTQMATGCLDGSVRLWKLPEVTLVHDVRGNAGEVVAATFSPDSRILLTASHDGTARFWDVASGKQLGPSLRHTDAVLAVAYHPDGRSVATGTKDGKTQRWHVPLAPEPGDTNQIRQKVEMLSGLGLDSQGTVHTLYANTLK
ncbi:WD40 repeat domain-containing protein, partial [Singulisphaera rosea]